jgi:ABC-type bacteriocin/lantibiotic exporter with double-glycine peptidase domain
MALLDVMGVASILPFMTVLTNPGIIESNLILSKMFEALSVFGVENNQQFLFALGILSFLLLVFSLTFKAITTYAQLLFVEMREYSIGKRLVEGYLHQPYSWFLNRHSADLGKTILSEVQQVNRNGMKSLMELIAQGTVIIALTILLVLIDPKLATIVGFSLIGIYGFIFYFIRNYLNKIGIKRLENNELRFILVSEAFGAIKEIKVGGLEPKYLKLFSKAAQIFARTQASSQIVSQLPRFILEAIAFGGILLILLFLIAKSGSFNTALPVLSLYIFAGYRMMPALQQVYRSFTELTFVGPSLNKLYDELENLKFVDDNQHHDTISFNKQISLKNIYYNYPNTSRTALVDINLTIPAKSTIGIIGPTGSGKTTMVDIILGLLEPQKGTLEVDGKVISKNKSKFWQKTIGYVPQHIYLSDDSIAANIAFGKKHEGVNKDKIEKAAKIANLHDFVMDELPKQYQTEIGERGIRLSGGQRQRIGIARALYHNPQVLILDEATSSLDNQTEKAVMDAVNNLSENITIILIAHRLNTVKNCDIVFKLDKGQLQRQGTFEELLNLNEQFEDSAKKI